MKRKGHQHHPEWIYKNRVESPLITSDQACLQANSGGEKHSLVEGQGAKNPTASGLLGEGNDV